MDPVTIYLIDASPYIFRGYHALPASLRDPAGRPINAVYGFAQSVIKLLVEEAPTHIALAHDGSLTTSFRNDLFPGYKAHRPAPPAELEAQLEACHAIGEALGVACFIDDRYEADDLIATLAAPLVAAGHRVVVVTSDKDLAQLAGERVSILDVARGTRSDAAAVRARFGVPPEAIPDLLALTGDAVDAIPGVPGIGPRTAAALIGAFGSVEALYDRLDEVAALDLRGARRVAERLAGRREAVMLSKRLATVAVDAPVSATLADLAWRRPGPAALEAALDRLGVRGLARRLAAG